MQNHDRNEIDRLSKDCLKLEEQIKVLVRTEMQLRRTKAELARSKQKIEEYNKTLEEKVEQRTSELIVSNEKLRQEMAEREKAEIELRKMEESLKRVERMEAIGFLAGNVAHNLNNLLTGIIGYPGLILRKLPEDSPFCKHLNAIKTCGEKGAAIVRELMTLSRKGILNTELVNLNTIIRTILSSSEMAQMKQNAPDVIVKNLVRTQVFNVRGSPVHIYNAFMNIIVNAFDSMKGGGTITVTTENVCIDKQKNSYELIAPGEYVTATFTDTGPEIPRQHLDRLFEPFYSRNVMGKSGTGLGMAIVWGAVKMHKGFIDVTSKAGSGTSVTLYFPATRNIKADDNIEVPPEQYPGNNESVLIIDDVDLQRDICREIVSELGYNPTVVKNGEEAIQCLQNRAIDLLILDMIMDPGMNGLETYRKILEIHPGQKAIIVSGFSESDLVTEAMALGAGTFVKKPYTLEVLGMAIRNELQRH